MVTVPASTGRLELHNGDHMAREEFHRVYEQMPEDFRAELIGGIVYVASPLKRAHGTNHPFLTALFVAYAGRTQGIEVGDNTTILLGDDSEPQPDLFLRILPEYGGQSLTTNDDYVQAAPEFVAEIAHSSRAIDLHAKYEDYRKYGVVEFLVVCLKENELRWFNLKANHELSADEDGVMRMRAFPGLWIHPEALLARDYKRMMATLEQGMAGREYAEFVKRLKAAKRSAE